MTVVDVDGLSVRYGDVAAVSDVTFSVDPGETVALVGANGAGKTSTINAIVGILGPTSGSVRVFGADPASDRSSIARRWGVMPQAGGLPMGLKVGECVALFADLYGRASDASGAVRDCGLEDVASRRWRTLSGGQQQRLSLAIALVGGHDLLILDEPTAALDVPGQDRVLDLVGERSDKGAAVLLTTHRFDEVERVADRVVVLHDGSVAANAPVSDLTVKSPEIRLGGLTVSDGVRINAALGTSFSVSGSDLVSPIAEDHDAGERLQAVLGWCRDQNLSPASASVGSRSLVDAYRELVGE